MHHLKTLLLIIACAGTVAWSSPARAQHVTPTAGWVKINGVVTPVFFNDGDTFRALAGPLRSRSARLAGFNTLESYGTVHQWGGWTFRELYVNAKQATWNARRGKWSCTADPSDRDGYGRILAICLDLGEDHIRQGLAHAMEIDGPSSWRYIQLQRQAIVHRRGMWAKGVPPAILTSLHSVDERPFNPENYNRLVSPLDGASTKWEHQDLYQECQKVCHPAKVVERAAALEVIRALRADAGTSRLVYGLEDMYLMALLNEYVTLDRVAQVFAADGHVAVKTKLDALKREGRFGRLQDVDGSCMIYATFDRRYRVKPRPKCLKGVFE